MSRRLCVVVGADDKGADVQIVRDGVPGRVFTVRGARTSLDAVSCAGTTGCIAVGAPPSGSIVYVVRVSRSGRPVGLTKVKAPSYIAISGISCTTLTSCAIAGGNERYPVTGWWNGRTLAVHQVSLPRGVSFQPELGVAVSCWRGRSCVAVGSAQRGRVNTGLFVPLHHGRPGRLRLVPGYLFIGVACRSARLCYAAGFNQRGGVVVTLRHGVPSAPRHLVAGMFAIACSGTGCTAVGAQTAPPPNQGTTDGVLATLSAGRLTSTAVVSLTGGYLSVARIGRTFVAVGNRQPKSVITSGRVT